MRVAVNTAERYVGTLGTIYRKPGFVISALAEQLFNLNQKGTQ